MNIVRFLVLPFVLLTHQNVLGAMHAQTKVNHERRRVHAQALGMTHATYARLANIRMRMKTPQSFDTCVNKQEHEWYREQLSTWLPRLLASSSK